MQSMMECYNVSGEPKDDDVLQNINIPETEGSRNVAVLNVPTDPISQLLMIRNLNIGTDMNLNFASVGDYWDEETMERITYLLHEFQDRFLNKFLEMKGILDDLGYGLLIPIVPNTCKLWVLFRPNVNLSDIQRLTHGISWYIWCYNIPTPFRLWNIDIS